MGQYIESKFKIFSKSSVTCNIAVCVGTTEGVSIDYCTDARFYCCGFVLKLLKHIKSSLNVIKQISREYLFEENNKTKAIMIDLLMSS